jgi:hypothetical protein
MDSTCKNPLHLLRKRDLSQLHLETDDKYQICQFINTNLSNVTDFSRSMNIPRETIRSWNDNYLHGFELQDHSGRPFVIDDEAENQLVLWINTRNLNADAPTPQEVDDMVKKQAKFTANRRNKVYLPICQETIRLIRKRLHIVTVKGQHKTTARIDAESDPRNSISMAIMFQSYAKDIDSRLLMNWDSTQIEIPGEVAQMCCHIPGTSSRPVTRPSKGLTSLFIKLFLLHNAHGDVAPPIFVIADKGMAANEIDPHQLVSLRLCGVGTKGWVVFSNTRQVNDKFFEWFVEKVLCVFVDECRKEITRVVS